MIKPIAEKTHLPVEFFLARVGEGRVADIMRQRQRLGQVFIETKRHGNRARHLSDFDGMSEAVAEVIVKAGREDLCLVLQPAKSSRVDDTVAIALKIVTIRVGKFGITPALRSLDGEPKAGQLGPVHNLDLPGGGQFAQSRNGGPTHRPAFGAQRLQ